MMKRVVLLLLLCIVAAVFAQAEQTTSAPAPAAAPQPTTSSPQQSGQNPLEWDYKDPAQPIPTQESSSNPSATPSENPATSAPNPTTSAPPPTTSAPPPPPATSAPPPPPEEPGCPPVMCPPVPPLCLENGFVTTFEMIIPGVNNGIPCAICDRCVFYCASSLNCVPPPATCKQLAANTTINPRNNVECLQCPYCYDCPVPTGCDPVPADCVNKGISQVTTSFGRVCDSCPVCRDNECPRPERCPSLGDDCIKVENRTLVYNNLTCPDCPICKERKVCPPATNCTPIPADCLATTTDKVIVDGMTCDGCPRCTLYQCPTPTCTPIRPQCKNITNTTITYMGQTCPGCKRCDDVCPALPACPAIPADCLKVEQRTRDVDGMTCPDCPVCTERPPQCPPASNCTEVPTSCKNVTTLTFQFQGLICPGCKQCDDCPIPANCSAIKPGCANITYDSFDYKGQKCQGCAKCNDPLCPPLKCPPVPPTCKQVVERWQTVNGVKCPDCPDLSLCDPCPELQCKPSNVTCDSLKETFVTVNGKKCPGCPECEIKCPVVKCPPLPSNCKKTVDTYFDYKGKQCLGCPVCKEKDCPVPQCPQPPKDCLKWNQTTYIYHDQVCKGCPVCVKFPCKNVCPPLQSDCTKFKNVTLTIGEEKCKCPICDTDDCPSFSCPPIDIKKCSRVVKTWIKNGQRRCPGCDKCIPWKCPTIKCRKIEDTSKCLAIEKRSFKFHGLTCVGCDRCVPKPKCRKCKCKDKEIRTVTIEKYLVKKRFVPYYVYHDTPCNVSTQVHRYEFMQTARRLRYIAVLKYRIKQYRTLVVHFRAVLRKLVVKKTISVETYLKISKIIKQMRHEMENQVRLGSVRLETIEKEMKRVRFLLKKLGERSFSPVSICKRVARKRICGLHPNYFYFNWQVKQGDNAPAPTYKKNYLKHYLWSTVVYTFEPSSVVKINKINRKKGIVVFTRRAKRWSKKVVKVNGFVRQYIWARIIAKLYRTSSRARKTIRKYIGFLNKKNIVKEVASVIADPRKKVQFAHLKKLLKRRFNRRVYKSIRKQLRNKVVIEMIKKHANIVRVKSFPAKEDVEMMRLPKSILNADGNTLIQLLSAKFKFQ